MPKAIDQIADLCRKHRMNLIYGGPETKAAFFISFMGDLQSALEDLASECGSDNDYVETLDFEEIARLCFDAPVSDDDDDRPVSAIMRRHREGSYQTSNGRAL